MQAIERGQRDMEAYRIGNHVIAADTEEDALRFYGEEVGRDAPTAVEALSISMEVPAGEGQTVAIRDLMNRIMDERCAWLRMGVPCDLHFPFIITKLK